MADILYRDPDLEWFDHVQPVGLVVAPSVLKELGLTPLHQSPVDTAEAAEHLSPDESAPALPDPWAFMVKMLGWNAAHVAGAPGGPELPDTLLVSLPEHATTLAPTWAVAELGQNGQGWQLLVRIEATGIEPDSRAQLDGWEASPHQRFERLLRDTGVFAGLLITDRELRLVYAPRGETSGYLSFPLRPLGMVAGRPMLGGLKLLLDGFRLFSDADERRLPALLKKSRDAQASVSTELAGQVLGALHELLRGLDAADADLIRELARSDPGHLYEGLLTVLMRLVFILYAEDRDLLPSRADARARAIYETSYSVRGLYARLAEDAALNPDTMDERRGGWGQLLALFRLIHKGHPSHFVQARGGKLFDPDEFPFLEGRKTKDDAPRILAVSDGCILRILEGLMTLKLRGHERERLSYRTLDVEQIGSVYETVMGFTVEVAKSSVLAIKAGKNNRTPVFVALDELLARKGKDRIKDLKENVGRSLTPAQAKPVEAAKTVEELAAAFEGMADERGSPRHVMAPTGTPILQPTGERRRTGSHYTPRSLTEPIVTRALEPAFERLGADATPDQILDLKVCDPAMGSGAFLVEACRAIATCLVEAWARWPETRPVIPADEDEELHARRLVAQRCLYGVDKNPRAVDLARLSLWLATLAKDHEFTFLDHALKCGDSLVGLGAAQISAMHWDTSNPGLPLFRQFVADRVAEATKARAEIRSAPDDTARAILEQKHRFVESRVEHVRVLGDAVLSAFFAEEKPKARERRRATVESWVASIGSTKWGELETAAASLRAVEHRLPPFHWTIEFPEVFARVDGGFDVIVGNPPFLGGTKISTALGSQYLAYLSTTFAHSGDRMDLVGYFFRRVFNLLREGGCLGLVGSNTIAQGDTRTGSLSIICAEGGLIYSAVPRLPWPGEAAVIVSIIHIIRGPRSGFCSLNNRKVERISAFLVSGNIDDTPERLAENARSSFEGFMIAGQGFLFDDNDPDATSLSEMSRLIAEDPRNRTIIAPYLGGKELNTEPRHLAHRYAINFRTMTEEEARQWPSLYALVREKVKPERDLTARESRRKRWWQYGETRPGLVAAVRGLDRVVACSQTSSYISFTFLPANIIWSTKLKIFPREEFSFFCILQSRIHDFWARFFGSTMKDDPVYVPTDCFETFPFPENYMAATALEVAGKAYYEYRAALMIARNEGMTKTYNRFHDRSEIAADIVRLRELHAAMDRAVLEAYGWDDLAERAAPIFLDETNEDDHTYQGRLFWPSDFRDEVLARLLALNAERHAEEVRLGIAPGMKGQPEAEDDEEASEEELTE
ncbi:MAG TPA: type IIL restriction-modification enzyme MmeI [Methylocella sp.]|nr:type IIL restriction-modification enzyme MmeI [Methylocella sp.]